MADRAAARPLAARRPRASGRFLYAGTTKLWVRGVTYGTFRPDASGEDYRRDRVIRDFTAIAANGFNAVRLYTVPPRWLLDVAHRNDLRVMIGVPWEQHVAFLEDRGRARDIERRVRGSVAACAGHPAVLCYAIGNEIPAPVARWHGRAAIEGFLERLTEGAREEDPGALVTYVNYPSTEYLDLGFADLVCFNVYLESDERFEAYLARLHNLAGDRPLVLGEIGFDSKRHGVERQARLLESQVRAVFASGCAGGFVFSWTDEWHRGGHDVEDWDFGLTDRGRRPKPALASVRAAMAEATVPKDARWPSISVIVCTYNGSRTIRECLDGLLRLEYPDFEVVVVNDGSTDGTLDIVREYPFRVISTENRGLSSARNTGLEASHGEIVVYIDDDAWPDPHWLMYLADTFVSTSHAGAGGPNLPPQGDGWIAECVAGAPGGPVHVLVSDREAEHVPGCNMAFRRDALEAIGGFDPQFRAAGDDVDVCWRLQKEGLTLGFHPGAMVWHHRRASVRAYFRQQRGYGRAEALLERKWPEKYNTAGHVSWAGRLYGGLAQAFGWRPRIYHGAWGAAPFQSVYEKAPGFLASLPAMPEWYLVVLTLAVFSGLGVLWRPLAYAGILLGGALAVPTVRAVLIAKRATVREASGSAARARSLALIALLHLLQPLARLVGRLDRGLTPWRRAGGASFALPYPRTFTIWNEQWRSPPETLFALEEALRDGGFRVRRGGDYDRWDLEARAGGFGGVRLLMATEEHGAGRQLERFRIWPRWSAATTILTAGLVAAGSAALFDGAVAAFVVLAMASTLPAVRALHECGACAAAFLDARRGLESATISTVVVADSDGAACRATETAA